MTRRIRQSIGICLSYISSQFAIAAIYCLDPSWATATHRNGPLK